MFSEDAREAVDVYVGRDPYNHGLGVVNGEVEISGDKEKRHA